MSDTIRILGEMTDLTNDGCGWSANCCWVKRYSVIMPAKSSDLQIARAIKREMGIQGFRVDGWSGEDWSWRDGCVGAWACVDENYNNVGDV